MQLQNMMYVCVGKVECGKIFVPKMDMFFNIGHCAPTEFKLNPMMSV